MNNKSGNSDKLKKTVSSGDSSTNAEIKKGVKAEGKGPRNMDTQISELDISAVTTPKDAQKPVTDKGMSGETTSDATLQLPNTVKKDTATDTDFESDDKDEKKNETKPDKGYTETEGTLIGIVKCIAYITGVLALSVIISVTVLFLGNDIYGLVKSEDPVEVVIAENATIDDVADELHDNGVIKYKWLFKMMNKDYTEFCAGTYTVVPKSSYKELVATFIPKAPTGISWVTIPEGYTTDEIIDLLVKTGIGSKEKYIDVINNYDFDYWFVEELGDSWKETGRIYRLDGYLFPDTYQFYNASSEKAVIDKLLKRFEQVYTKSLKTRAEEMGFTVDQTLIIASLIEKEAASAAEFGDVSSVFHNRLKNPATYPYLESDATIVYAIQHDTGVRPDLKP